MTKPRPDTRLLAFGLRRPNRGVIAALAFGVGALASACTASRVAPEANVDVSGRVSTISGPAAGARISLIREADPGDVLLTVTSLGLACLSQNPHPSMCGGARVEAADSGGRFDFALKGRDTQATFGTSAVLALTTRIDAAAGESDGASTTYRFHAQTERLDLPVAIWQPSLTARTGALGARVGFGRVPAGLLAGELARGAVTYAVEFARGNELVWRNANAAPSAAFDPRVLEDSSGTVRVVAGFNGLRTTDALGSEVALALRSGGRAYASPAGAPPSRGKPCFVEDPTGRETPVAPCVLTDGVFDKEFSPRICASASCVEPRHAAAVVDLEQRAPVSLIVVRGCLEPCAVETSADGRSWSLAGIAQAYDAALSIAAPTPVRYVRVRGDLAVDALTEVSAWSALPRLPDASFLVSAERFPAAGRPVAPAPGSAPTSTVSSGRSVWELAATGLLGAAVGGLLVALSRRRRAA